MSETGKVSAHFVVVFLICAFTSIVFALTSGNSKNLIAGMQDQENLVYLKVEHGIVAIQLLPEVAPNHVKRIKELVRSGFYDGIKFHRVIKGFMAQTGDPTGTGTGGSGVNLKAEFSDVSHTRGMVSMARAQDEDSADSQFFIVLEDSTFLDEKYTVWGRVVSGMEHVDKIKVGDKSRNGMVSDPDSILSMVVAADSIK